MKILRALKKFLRVLARPVQRERGYLVYPYRGYGSSREIFLMGRVFFQATRGLRDEGETTGRLLFEIVRRLFLRGTAGAVLEARFYGASKRVTTDRYGYFSIQMQPEETPPGDRLWHNVEIRMIEPEHEHIEARGVVFIPPSTARFVVISDIDDTVIQTGVTNKLKMFWRLFSEDAYSRVAFPGVASFYDALHRGSTGVELNPILYVSRGPWGLYELLDEFFNRHRIPIGPILFLREWGVSFTSPLPERSKEHKSRLIHRMISVYGDHPFILIGDSGEHDPEIYARVVHEFPGRVMAVYIRNVSRKRSRRSAIETLASEVAAAGSSLLLASDTQAMATHAVEHGFIEAAALEAVRQEREAEMGIGARRSIRKIEIIVGAGEEDLEGAEFRKAVDEEGPDHRPPNVAIEPDPRPGKKPPRSR